MISQWSYEGGQDFISEREGLYSHCVCMCGPSSDSNLVFWHRLVDDSGASSMLMGSKKEVDFLNVLQFAVSNYRANMLQWQRTYSLGVESL